LSSFRIQKKAVSPPACPICRAYGEGETEEEAIADLREAIRGYIEAFGIDDALARISAPVAVRQLDWDLTELTYD